MRISDWSSDVCSSDLYETGGSGTGGSDFGGKAMTYYGRWPYKYEEAARQGTTGLLVIHETEPASYGWATVQNSNNNTPFDVVRAAPSTPHTPMQGRVPCTLAGELSNGAGLDFQALPAPT